MSSTQPDQSIRQWYALEVEIETAAREAVEYALMEGGALGTETNDAPQTNDTVNSQEQPLLRVTGYFDSTPSRESLRVELADALRIYDLPAAAVREMSVREIADQDWLGEWKKSWQPVELGRLVIAPPWSEVKAARDRVVIRIEPGMAFGTGTHETTRLCLKAMMRFFKGASFLDVGTGTGILAIAAAKLFPNARVAACDTDPEAIQIARENAQLNGVAERIDFRVGTVDESGREPATASADFVCANLTADVISPLLPALIGASCGRLVLSGILESQVDAIVDQLHDLGNDGSLVMMQDGEWVALVI